MVSVEILRERLKNSFLDYQAKAIAEAIIEVYKDLVKIDDFNELKQIVKEIAQEQKKLAEAQKQTEKIVQELVVEQKKLAEAQKQTEKIVQELVIEQKKLAEAQKQTEKEIRNLAKQVGGLSEAFGGSLEDFALDIVPELLEKYWNLKIKRAERSEFIINGKTYQIDLYIEGEINHKPILVFGEVKSNLTSKEVKNFFSTVRRIHISKKKNFNSTEIRVLFFGFRANREARELIKSKNSYLIFTNGKIL